MQKYFCYKNFCESKKVACVNCYATKICCVFLNRNICEAKQSLKNLYSTQISKVAHIRVPTQRCAASHLLITDEAERSRVVQRGAARSGRGLRSAAGERSGAAEQRSAAKRGSRVAKPRSLVAKQVRRRALRVPTTAPLSAAHRYSWKHPVFRYVNLC